MNNIDIDILESDGSNILVKKQPKKENNITEVVVEEKKKKSLRRGEKAFLFLNIFIIVGLIGFYAYRTYYYYHLTHDVVENIHLGDKLTTLSNIAYQNDGLYEKNGYFYYKGSDVNNYVYYSGRMFRIVDISNGIRMIEDDTETNLVWSVDSDFANSNIYNWLSKYLSTLKDYEVFLEKDNWCNDTIDIKNYHCEKTIDSYVGLLSTEDYLQAGGSNSYLNNSTYFWTINKDSDGNVYYVNGDGNINNILKKDDNYYSYGIRPVITLKKDISIVSGDGSRENPFIIENLGNALLKDNSIGSYVNYNKENYRILDIDEEGISLISENVLEIPKKYHEINSYLNNEYLKKYNLNELVKRANSLQEYSYENKYSFENDEKSKEDYITIPKIGDLFLREKNGYWLNNYSDSKLGLYYTIDENNMFFSDLKNNTHYIRPIIKLNIDTVVSSGLGMENNPLVIGEEDVEEI